METSEINKLGKDLELYTTIDYIGKGFPIILPRGMKIINLLHEFVEREEENHGYKVVRTPSVSKSEIYIIEDRFETEKDEMFIIKNESNDKEKEEENSIVLRPYVQPFHCSIYKTKKHSYKELPIKYSETSTVFRNEKDIKGIARTRQITLSDASIFTEPSKLEKSIKESILIQKKFIKKMNLEVTYSIANWKETKKEDYIGNIEEWESTVSAMKKVLEELKIDYTENNGARMYGPSIQIKYNDKDFSTIQVDFEITHRFDLKYTNKNNEDMFPIYIHRTTIGSYENLLAILIEKFQGKFPLWISPVQVQIITEGEEFADYADEVKQIISQNEIRVEINNSDISYQDKLNKAVQLKIPYVITIGKKELNHKIITVKELEKDETKKYKIEDFIKEVISCQTKY